MSYGDIDPEHYGPAPELDSFHQREPIMRYLARTATDFWVGATGLVTDQRPRMFGFGLDRDVSELLIPKPDDELSQD